MVMLLSYRQPKTNYLATNILYLARIIAGEAMSIPILDC